MAENRIDEAEMAGTPNPTEGMSESVPMIGEYRIDYSPLSREELDATCPETEELIARSTLVQESPEI